MKILGKAELKTLYDVIRVKDYGSDLDDTKYSTAQLHVMCGNTMTTRFKLPTGLIPDAGYTYYCPHCGQYLWRKNRKCGYGNSYFFESQKNGLIIPEDMSLRVIEYKNYVDLEAVYHATRLVSTDTELDVMGGVPTCKCTIRADIGRQVIQVINRGWTSETYDVDMAAKPDWPLDTPFRYLTDTSRAVEHQKPLRDLFRVWRKTIEHKLHAKLKYEVPSMYCATSITNDAGVSYGIFFKPLQNMAWRLSCPTGPKYDRELQREAYLTANASRQARKVLEATRAGTEYATAVCDAYGLPQTKAMRAAVRAPKKMFSAVPYMWATHMTHDINHIITVGKRLGVFHYNSPISFLKILAHQYNIGTVESLLRSHANDAIDTSYMYYRLSHANRKAFWALPHVKARDLHDTVLAMHDHQRFANYAIQITRSMAHLAEKVNDLEFYVPDQTDQLVTISAALHNCVKTYGERCRDHKCTIVGVKQNGSIVACIEVRGNAIVQAKLLNNAPASHDNALNCRIVLWAGRHNLIVGTHDMKTLADRQKAV